MPAHPTSCCCPHHRASSPSPVMPALILLFLAAVVVMVYKAQLVNSIANVVALALCSVPCGWIGFQLCAEAKFAWACRRYVAPRPAPLAITARVPLAIEAARPTMVVIEHEAVRWEN